MFDDEIEYAQGSADGKKKAQEVLYDFMAKAKPSFKVTYNDGKPAQTLTWADYVKNMTYLFDKGGTTLKANTDLVWGFDNVQEDPDGDTAFPKWMWPTLLRVNEENEDHPNTWTFYMDYVSQEFLTSGDKAYLARFNVDVPIYRFVGNLVAKNNPGYSKVSVPLPSAPSSYWSTNSGQASMGTDLERELKAAWSLTGVYQFASDRLTRPIGITSRLFTQGNYANAPGAGISSTEIRLDYKDGEKVLSTAYKAGGATSGVINSRNYPLPLYYRGETLEDKVLIDVYYQYPGN